VNGRINTENKSHFHPAGFMFVVSLELKIRREWFRTCELVGVDVVTSVLSSDCCLFTSIDKCSQTQLLIFVLLRGVSTWLVLTTTCFGRFIGHHQVVHSPILKQTVQYAMFLSTGSCAQLQNLHLDADGQTWLS
jgi:hypothetical protein